MADHPVVLPQDRPQSLGEDIANSISRGVALLAGHATAGQPFWQPETLSNK